MTRLFYQHVCYSTELPAFAVRQQLVQVVQPLPTGWRRWLGFRPRCRGLVGVDTFRARVANGRSDGPVVEGNWQSTLLAGTHVELTIRIPAETWIGAGVFLLWNLLLVSLTGIFTHPARLLSPAGLLLLPLLVFTLLTLADLRWSLRRARRYFEDALQLIPLPA